MGERHDTTRAPGARRQGRPNRLLVAALAIYAVAAPLTVSAIGTLRPEPPLTPLIGTIALGVALLGPGLAAVALAVLGLGTIDRRLAGRADELPHIVARLAASGAVLAYLGGLAVSGGAGGALLPMLAVAIPGILCAWLSLVHLMVRPDEAILRRGAALVGDIVLVTAFLYFGNAFGAPGFALYLGTVLGNGAAFGVVTLGAGAVLALLGLAILYAAAPFWHAQPFLVAAIAATVALASAILAAPIRRLARIAAEASAAANSRRRFLAIIGHELRTPLTSIIGMGELIERTALDPPQREMLATLQSSSRGLATLVDDLLDYARLDAGKMAPSVEPFSLREALGAAVAELRPEAEAKGLALSLDIDPRLPDACRGFAMPLRQVTTNLVANAVKFTAHGRVSVSAALLERGGGRLRLQLAVRDDGIGIPDDVRDRIFDAFAQADESVAQRFGGTGLGLAIAKEFAELMGGSIRVESRVGAGSTFVVELTLDEDSSAPSRIPDLTGRRLLVVTADGAFAGQLRARLEAWRGEPVWHADAEPVLAMLAADRGASTPALLLLDGRDDPLAALALAHRIATTVPRQPLLLFIAGAAGSRAIADIAPRRFAAIVEAPVSDAALAGALLSMMAAAPHHGGPADGAAAPDTVPAIAVAARPLTVLVADDDGANRKILTSALQAAGHEVVVAPDGAAALALIERQPFDLALLDINMPGMSGDEVARRHRAKRLAEPRVTMVALTADVASETERLCRDAGMDAVLVKPIDAGRLLRALDEVHGRTRAPGAAVEAAADDRGAAAGGPRVTPISAHPRFVPEGATVVDEATMAALRTLGGNDFVADVVASFRSDAWRLLGQLRNAVARSDVRGFRDAVHSLRSGSANIGAMRLCQTLTALRDVGVPELRQTGLAYIDKVEAELTRLDASLDQLVREQRRV